MMNWTEKEEVKLIQLNDQFPHRPQEVAKKLGGGRTLDSIKKKLERLKVRQEQSHPELNPTDKITEEVLPWACCFDLETTNLSANWMGVILCGVVKPWGGKLKIFRGDQYPTWRANRSNDEAICRSLFAELKKYRIWIAHNGVNYDINYLRTRLGKYGFSMDQPMNIDPVIALRKYYRLNYNSLERAGRHFGFKDYKTHLDEDTWMQAIMDGSSVAMDEIVYHCEKDVELLELVANRVKYLIPKITKWGSAL